jgi:Family of unknown function (DUF5988)
METIGICSAQAVLEGGPESIPAAQRMREVGSLDEKIKLPHHGGYEHFERVSALEGSIAAQRLVYRWTMRTEVAE